MLAILNFLNAHNLPMFQPILMILVSKFMVHRALSDKTYLLLGLLSPLNKLQNQTQSSFCCAVNDWNALEQTRISLNSRTGYQNLCFKHFT